MKHFNDYTQRGQVQEILVLNAYMQKPLTAYADISIGARGLIFGLSLPLHTHFVYEIERSTGCGWTAHLCMLTRVLTAPRSLLLQVQKVVCAYPCFHG